MKDFNSRIFINLQDCKHNLLMGICGKIVNDYSNRWSSSDKNV